MDSVIFVAGARPNFMKIAPILKAAHGAPFKSVLAHTGQHYDHAMSGVFFEQLGIPAPDVHLEIGSGTHGVQTGRIMGAFEEYLLARQARPRAVVVVGDVNSTMACALVAAKLGIMVVHVEAGLRSFDRSMPEEINRVVTDQVSDMLLVSEPSGLENLEREGIAKERVHYVGNVMIDSLVQQLDAARAAAMPQRLGVQPGRYGVVTLHRPSNVDSPARLRAIVGLLETQARRGDIVFPVHPRTSARLREFGLLDALSAIPGLRVVEPLGYREFVGLVADAAYVFTDSGGIQEEATYLGVPCLTMRGSTERPATLTHGTNRLLGEDLDSASKDLETCALRRRAGPPPIEGWDGRAATRIISVLVSALATTS